jgi:hypothetical protein
VYQPSDEGESEEFSNGARDGEGEVMAATACELPCIGWDGLWDSLIYADNIKLKLLEYVACALKTLILTHCMSSYIHATLVLSDANVDCW